MGSGVLNPNPDLLTASQWPVHCLLQLGPLVNSGLIEIKDHRPDMDPRKTTPGLCMVTPWWAGAAPQAIHIISACSEVSVHPPRIILQKPGRWAALSSAFYGGRARKMTRPYAWCDAPFKILMPERWVLTTCTLEAPGRGWLRGNPLTFRCPHHSRKEEVNLLGPLRIKIVNKVALGKSHPGSTACLLIIQLQIWRRRVWHIFINVLLRASQARIREYCISIMNSLESKEEVRKRSKSDHPTEFFSRYLVTLYSVTLYWKALLCMSSKGRKT